MLEAKINDYGKEKLKNLAKYTKLDRYPIIYFWRDLNSQSPRKFILYFAIPDDRGNTWTIPAKWCEDITDNMELCQVNLELNANAIDQLGQVAKFTNDVVYPVFDIWEDALMEGGKKRFNIYFAILNTDKKVFPVQSTWGKTVILDKNGTPVYI
jgi:hypothetical protein